MAVLRLFPDRAFRKGLPSVCSKEQGFVMKVEE